ncbi:MBL fold metallo-hydrolase [Ktedonobacter racemifer]|uniref:Beta-lactamase domain protein n=1 Tax=Ktedonobacter racemifer DSM 44963 TaxID=485913 RepID=D6TDR3_KTERA|nr:MBL fold metallo-hydrolase [Ktedonobacter racemifer]EFH90195.1 beta-lactamase domain protein [Ktedonobacter racemifer DSM 44963]
MAYIKRFESVKGLSGDERVRVFRSAFAESEEKGLMEVDAYAIITRDYVVVCDTLLCPEDMEAVLREVQDELAGRQLLVVNSHADWDHTWGNNYFQGRHAAPIIAHASCRERMLAKEAQEGLDEYQKRFDCFQHVVLRPPTLTFNDQLTIEGGDLTLQLLHTPGHQRDQVSLWIPELRLLLAFDVAEFPLPSLESEQAAPLMLSSLERLCALQPERVLCGHGKRNSVATLTGNLAYFREIERRARLLLSQMPLPQFKENELKSAPNLLGFSFEEAIATLEGPCEDDKFYRWVHNQNCRHILQWVSQ